MVDQLWNGVSEQVQSFHVSEFGRGDEGSVSFVFRDYCRVDEVCVTESLGRARARARVCVCVCVCLCVCLCVCVCV